MRAHTIEHEGLTLGLLTAGDPRAPALVLLHGWPHSKEAYDRVIDPLGASHFVLAFDLPAVGASRGAPRSAEKHRLADIVIGAAERAGATAMVVAGFDVGGMIAFAAARDHGARIAGAVIMNTVLPGLDPWANILSDPRVWHFAFHAIPELPERLVAGHQRAYFDYFFEVLVGNKRAVPERYRSMFARAYERPEALTAGFDWYRAMAADAKRNAEPREIRTPILYVRGDADGRSPEPYVRGLEAGGAKHVQARILEGSGELAPLEAPESFTAALLGFARECRSSYADW
ncbi:MAG TPA: alpha/beta hydrolase [Gammaproteobacteria bacterium]|nr:alpha/beta hydrolase [Gammaproteobacteria bacterium]